ncbi:MAG: undecaprenyl-diphosphatase [Psychromonas sp.]|nr:undecaprenyl-diphosphatase [Psychromonas sp.]
MEPLNQTLFLLINAGAHPNFIMVMFAKVLAELPIWLIPVLLIMGWLSGDALMRKAFLASAISAGFALSVNQLLGLFWQHPRPLMMGLGHTLIAHAADSSFPSDHMTLICSVAFSLLWHSGSRPAGIILLCCSLFVAWARIYLGVHFPLDMVGSVVVAAVSAAVVQCLQKRVVEPIFQPILSLYERVFATAIKQGWMK